MKVPLIPISPLKVVSLLAAALTVPAFSGCGSDTTTKQEIALDKQILSGV